MVFHDSGKKRIAKAAPDLPDSNDAVCLHCGYRQGQHFIDQCPTKEEVEEGYE